MTSRRNGAGRLCASARAERAVTSVHGKDDDVDRAEQGRCRRWFTEFWGADFNPAVIDELAAPDIRFEYSLHAPCRGRDEVRAFAARFRAAFPDVGGTADLIAEGDYVVGQWIGGDQTGDAFVTRRSANAAWQWQVDAASPAPPSSRSLTA